MPENDLKYYSRRAEFEFERANAATLPKVAAAHHRLASAYLQRIIAAKAENRVDDA